MSNTKPFRSFSRRHLFGVVGAGVMATGLGVKILTPKKVQGQHENAPTITADQALKKLMEGNQRWVEHKLIHPHQEQKDITAVAEAQHPFAILLGCADSRVSPELIFDVGVGDLFDIRVAGHVLDNAVKGSIEYAVAELGVSLVMVMGHERCGAVKAALEGKPLPGQIGSLVTAIAPSVASVKGLPGDFLDNAVKANIKRVVEELKTLQPILSESVKANKLKIVGARYDLDTGKVEAIA